MKKSLVVCLLVVATCALAAVPVKKYFFCKNCGTKFATVQSLTSSTCQRHPSGKGLHELYEGNVKTLYTCKYCGKSSGDIRSLTSSKCMRHPKGPAKGYHSPAL